MPKQINVTLTEPQWRMLEDCILRGEIDIEMDAVDEWSEYSEKDLAVLRRATQKILHG
tara:strand:- start:1221 stop:1394 length:174 start_codon:yes stop_codon:yes gene_type:complete